MAAHKPIYNIMLQQLSWAAFLAAAARACAILLKTVQHPIFQLDRFNILSYAKYVGSRSCTDSRSPEERQLCAY